MFKHWGRISLIGALSLLGSSMAAANYMSPAEIQDRAQYQPSEYHQADYRYQAPAQAVPVGGLPSQIRPHGERVFMFSPRHKQWAAYDSNGRRIAYGRANGGSHYCKDLGRACRTPQGTFRVIGKRGADCRSGRYPKPNGGAPMPYCTFFHKAGYAVHGSPRIGPYNSSHGCIRVTTSAAKWLQHNFFTGGTKVVVTSY